MELLFHETTRLLRWKLNSRIDLEKINNPDIIILDILLPKMNGYDVCKSIKSDPAIFHAKVLMTSGVVQNSNWQKVQEVGADAFIAKPFDSIALVEKVAELLRSN